MNLNDTGEDTEDEHLNGRYIWIVLTTLYGIIFLIGVIGNFLVMYIVIKKKPMQTCINIFIANLALADTVLCLLAVPFTPISFHLESWIFGEIMCKIIPVSMAVSVFVSSLTLTAIAVDRYFAVLRPLKPPMTPRGCVVKIVAIWITSVVILIPLVVLSRVIVDDEGNEQCVEQWPNDDYNIGYTFILFVLQFIVPSVIITYCYVCIYVALHRRAQSPIGDGSVVADANAAEIQRTRRINRMLISVVLVFVCCWLPLNVTLLINQLDWINQKAYIYLFFPVHVIAMSSAVYNPFLYALMSEKFKAEYKQCFSSICAF